MRFEWDEAKRWSNLEKHGFDFQRAIRIFDGRPRLDIPSRRGDEERVLSVAVAWTQRDLDAVRIISVRRARRAEEKQHRQLHG